MDINMTIFNTKGIGNYDLWMHALEYNQKYLVYSFALRFCGCSNTHKIHLVEFVVFSATNKRSLSSTAIKIAWVPM